MTALDTAKERLSVMDAWKLLGLPGQPKVGANHSPFRDDKSPSLSIFKDGRRWKDHGTDEGGSVADFVAVAKNISIPEAVKEVLRLADLFPGEMPKPEAVHRPVPVWGGECRTRWREGVEWLSNQKAIREGLASWRGWPVVWVDALNESGLLGCPKVGGERGTAFSVARPTKQGTETIGFHVRLKTGGWRYEPKGIRAIPFVMGATESRKVIITEGQWDAVTLAGCAGWLDRHEAWPEEVCLFGIRGGSGTGAFLEAYGEILSRTRPEVVVIRDNDLPGERWKTTFFLALAEIVGVKAVRCVRMAEGKDINETHQKNPLTPQEVAEILKGK